MKKPISLILFIFLSLTHYGQKYGNIWYFGNKAGLDFNNCTPVVLTDGANSGFEGTATICNSLGQLLFYTNSDTIWNKNHKAMPNGALVNSSGSLSQVLIIPKPSSGSLYYIITTVIQGGALTPTTLQFHTVDMTLNGGSGDVVSKIIS